MKLAVLDRFFSWFERLITDKDPTRVLVVGYISYVFFGFLFLLLPFSQSVDVSFIDSFFIAVSAVSTTGLITIDPSSSYTFFGELVILVLMQLGGLGYMTLGSFIILQSGHRLSNTREEMTRTAFPLPRSLDIKTFLKSVMIFTFTVEALGAVLLSIVFFQSGVDSPLWHGIFHSVSAFCTAGFSLNSDSFVSFASDWKVNAILSVLSIFGAMGFIVVTDIFRRLTRKSTEMTFTTLVIGKITGLFLVMGTLFLYFVEPSIRDMDFASRLLAAFFQAMSSTTTVGFNSVDLGSFAYPSIMLLFFFMLFGASPSGTGGGLKSTTFAALFALVRSTLQRDQNVCYMKRRVPIKRLQLATTSFIFSGFVLGLSVFLLTLSESQDFYELVFEAFSALGTVGLSTGITGELTVIGKLIVCSLMMIGRVGVLSFGLAISTTYLEEIVDADNELLM